MRNDKKIKSTVKQLFDECKDYLTYVNTLNECAYSDRKVESIINISKDLESKYKEQFNEKIQKTKRIWKDNGIY